jgi:hypothetical protein
MLRASRFAFILFALSWGCAQSPATPLSTQAGANKSSEAPSAGNEISANKGENERATESRPSEATEIQGKQTQQTMSAPQTPAKALGPPQAPPLAAKAAAQPALKSGPTAASEPTQDRPDAYVTLAQFTTEIEDQEPVDSISFLDTQKSEIIFFTDVQGFAGETLVHRWEYQGQVMSEVPFDVQEDHWRGWSSKQLLPDWLGDWTVSVVKSDGEVIAAESFSYSQNR